MLSSEIQKRRTFAIISHPDAGKTTLTEKLLLFGGAIQVAGAVKSNKIKKHATSDFLEIEKQRGISVATSVMTFTYQNILINLLDTPGHKDFAEDTYRTLSAVDSVIVVIDSVKGVESQTEKLMEVCRMRDTPVLIFINKLDRDGKDPYDLLSELEEKLQLTTHPLSFPIGMGRNFKGVYNLYDDSLRLFRPHTKNQNEARITLNTLAPDALAALIGTQEARQLSEDRQLIQGVYGSFSVADYLSAKTAPVFFGSAINNFGVKELLETFIRIAPPPQKRPTTQGIIAADQKAFSGFIFKIHANIDPKHRDRIAFLRVCSGVFKRGQNYHHVRLAKKMRFAAPYSFLAREKNILDSAYPGDIVGLFDTGNFKIGDTLTEGAHFYFTGIPSFSPEIFKAVRNQDPMKTKQLEKGLVQLTDEGVAQLFTRYEGSEKIIGCVGDLQFEVIQHRLLHEYGAQCSFIPLPFYKACWISADTPQEMTDFIRFKTEHIAKDKDNAYVYLAQSEWLLETTINNNPQIHFQFSDEIHKHIL